MELILKTPADKPPFIGVLFDSIHEAAAPNKMLFNSDTYKLLINSSHKL